MDTNHDPYMNQLVSAALDDEILQECADEPKVPNNYSATNIVYTEQANGNEKVSSHDAIGLEKVCFSMSYVNLRHKNYSRELADHVCGLSLSPTLE